MLKVLNLKKRLYFIISLTCFFLSIINGEQIKLDYKTSKVYKSSYIDTIDLSLRKSIILPNKLDENSGLVYHKGSLWTFNDSGGKAEIYKIDIFTGKITQKVKIKNSKNRDWEDITISDKHIYIGDFGNNLGVRKNLRIYKIPIPNKTTENLEAEVLKFTYPEQKSFKNKGFTVTNFDAEGMVFYDNKLHIFTKEWTTNKTTHYILDVKEKYQEAKKVSCFNIEGLVTAAAIHKNKLKLLAYTKDGLAFMYDFSNVSNERMFNNPLKTVLGVVPLVGQVEGLEFNSKKIYISAEEFSRESFSVKQRLYILTNN